MASKSEAYRRPEVDWRPKCRDHGPPAVMEPAVLLVRYPSGELPGRGFRCPVCARETLLLEESARLNDLARKLGLYGLEAHSTRKLLRTGNSIAVSLDPELAREVLGTTKPGAKVRVGRVGDRIVVMRA